jgi:uncharacterized protein
MKTIKTFPRKIRETSNTFITLADGCKLAARIWMPVDADKKPVPAILEYLPYRKRDGTHVRDALTHPYMAGHGYACIRVDMRGSGDSDGLMEDEYTQQELDDAVEVIAWLAAQPWCCGTVGMMGISWGGFNGLQVAALQPPALKAIVTLCSTDDRYSDDIHYKGGCLLNENLGWSATMFAYSSRPPDPALVGERWRAMWLQRLEHEPLLAIPWLEHPHRDAYWKHGSVCEDIGAIQAAVLAVGGWNDAYTNAVPRLVGSVKSPVKGIIGPWAHKYPHFAVPEPRIGFLQEMLRWWDQWLKGMDTGVARDPAHRTYIMEPGRPGAAVAQVPGRWVSDNHWPSDIHALQRLHLNANGMLGPVKGSPGKCTVASPQTTGADAGEYCIIWLGPEFPGDQRRDDAGSVTFDSAPLARDIDIVGATAVQLKLSSDKPLANIAVRLNAVWPDGAVSRLSYGVLNLSHRDSHETPEPLEPGKTYTVRLQLDDVAVKVRRGQRLRIAISTSYWPLIWPAPEAPTLTLNLGTSFVDLPVRKTRPNEAAPAFAPPEAASPVRLTEVRPASNRRELLIDQKTGAQVLTIVDDFGASTIDEHGLTYGAVGRETYRIHPDDPLSAVQECHWTEERSRGDWKVRTETYSAMRATKTHWHVTGRLEAYEGDALIFSRDWDRKIKRKLV